MLLNVVFAGTPGPVTVAPAARPVVELRFVMAVVPLVERPDTAMLPLFTFRFGVYNSPVVVPAAEPSVIVPVLVIKSFSPVATISPEVTASGVLPLSTTPEEPLINRALIVEVPNDNSVPV